LQVCSADQPRTELTGAYVGVMTIHTR